MVRWLKLALIGAALAFLGPGVFVGLAVIEAPEWLISSAMFLPPIGGFLLIGSLLGLVITKAADVDRRLNRLESVRPSDDSGG